MAPFIFMTKEPKKLYRSKDRMIAGICAGIAEYFNIDPTIIRIIFVLLLLPGGLPGFIPYILLWIIIPTKPTVEKQ
jgi:phage shock protein C